MLDVWGTMEATRRLSSGDRQRGLDWQTERTTRLHMYMTRVKSQSLTRATPLAFPTPA